MRQRGVYYFRGRYGFLSNFYPSPIVVNSVLCATVEHAFQAAKAANPQEALAIMTAPTPETAKAMGQRCRCVPDWDTKRVEVMRTLLARKFAAGSLLAQKLLATGTTPLIEGNDWGDTFWGKDDTTWTGENMLGVLLMERRDVLRRDVLRSE